MLIKKTRYPKRYLRLKGGQFLEPSTKETFQGVRGRVTSIDLKYHDDFSSWEINVVDDDAEETYGISFGMDGFVFYIILLCLCQIKNLKTAEIEIFNTKIDSSVLTRVTNEGKDVHWDFDEIPSDIAARVSWAKNKIRKMNQLL